MSATGFDYDALVVGSGFGGSITALHLARAGLAVCVLERGAEWPRGSFPRGGERMRDLFWDPAHRAHGILDYRRYGDLDVLVGSGVGGGSLVYSSFLAEPDPEAHAAWPAPIRYDALAAHRARVLDVMDARPYPADRPPYDDTPRLGVFRDAAARTGHGQLGLARLATSFAAGPSEWGATFTNRHGAVQTGCIMCGECNVGCRYHAKNTLDLNYLHLARRAGAELRAGHEVDRIEPLAPGYRVVARDLRAPDAGVVTLTARRLVLAAGSLGSTELLLRARDRDGTLPAVSRRLGEGFSANGNDVGLLAGIDAGPAVEPSRGPTLTFGIRMNGLVIEDTGMADFIAWYLDGLVPTPLGPRLGAAARVAADVVLDRLGARPRFGLIGELASILVSPHPSTRSIFYITVGRDGAAGRLHLDGDGRLALDWREDAAYRARLREEVDRLAAALGATVIVGKRFSFHPVGGCAMGESPASSVVGLDAQVHGHPDLHVIDGAVLPGPVGVNPALTIAAVAERVAEELAHVATR